MTAVSLSRNASKNRFLMLHEYSMSYSTPFCDFQILRPIAWNLKVHQMLLFVLLFFCSLNLRTIEGCKDVQIVPRADWGARVPRENEQMTTPVPHLFIHHTATGECNDFQACARMMRSIQNFHMDDRGWDDIGYNFLIGGDGRVYEGRGWTRVGAHTYGYNRKAIAFSLMGNFSNKLPSEVMLNATLNMIACAVTKDYVRDYKLHGHRDAGCTECPGNSLYELIKSWNNFEGGPLATYNC